MPDRLNTHLVFLTNTLGCVCPNRRVLFFEAEYERGVQYYLNRYFSSIQCNQYTGEARHRNLLLSNIPRRIAEAVDNPRFVVVLRDPLERANSLWWHWKAREVETRSFHEVVSMGIQGREFYGLSAKELEQANPGALIMNGYGQGYSRFEAYVASSRYAEQLERYLALFGKERILIIFHEDLIRGPAEVVRRIWEFLELDTDEKLNLEAAFKNTANNLRAARWVKRLKNVPGSFLVSFGLTKRLVSTLNIVVGSHDYRITREKNLQSLGSDLSRSGLKNIRGREAAFAG